MAKGDLTISELVDYTKACDLVLRHYANQLELGTNKEEYFKYKRISDKLFKELEDRLTKVEEKIN